MGLVLVLVPAGAHAHLDAPARHLVHRDRDLGEVAGRPERDGRDERAEVDPGRFAGKPRQHGPGVRGGVARGPREALVVVGAEHRLEAARLSPPGDGQLVRIGHALLRLDHQRKAHRCSPSGCDAPSG